MNVASLFFYDTSFYMHSHAKHGNESHVGCDCHRTKNLNQKSNFFFMPTGGALENAPYGRVL